MGHSPCRAVNRSPIDFRQGRRASDGLVAQGILNQVDNPTSSVAFNSQRLHEACKAKGVLELHLLQQEAASLSSQYQSCVPQEEIIVRQREHSQFHVGPLKASNDGQSALLYHYKNDDLGYYNKTISGITTDISNFVGVLKSEELAASQSSSSLQKPPLQQQLMQHRLLQQKRQILQKQGAMEACLSRRQTQHLLRQQSYKMAQNQQILPPLPFPLTEKESEDLLAFQQKIENPSSPSCTSPSMCPSTLIKSTHIQNNQFAPSLSLYPQSAENGVWNNLTNNLNSCQISEAASTHEIYHQPLCQVHSIR